MNGSNRLIAPPSSTWRAWPLLLMGGFDGEPKRYQPRGFVLDKETNSIWGMQFVWPYQGDFRIVYLNDDDTQRVIGREKRDCVWIMARQPTIPEDDYQRIIGTVGREGCDTAEIRKVPQRWGARPD